MAAKNASGFFKTLLLTFLTRPSAHIDKTEKLQLFATLTFTVP